MGWRRGLLVTVKPSVRWMMTVALVISPTMARVIPPTRARVIPKTMARMHALEIIQIHSSPSTMIAEAPIFAPFLATFTEEAIENMGTLFLPPISKMSSLNPAP